MSNFILCDIGNTFFHFYYSGRMWREKPSDLTEKRGDIPLYYISVNDRHKKKLLSSHDRCVDIEPYLDLDTSYVGLGADRKAACLGIDDGVVVDAGSAITVDVVQDRVHLGGYIMPGIDSYRRFYSEISPVLNIDFSVGVDLQHLPQGTRDAISFGTLKGILLMIKDSSRSKKVYFTGGDGKFFSKFFENSIFDETLIFKGMQRALHIASERFAGKSDG